MAHRDHTRRVCIGDVVIGGGAPVRIQSMTNTKTEDAGATIAQIHALEEAGCEIARCTVPTAEAAKALSKIKAAVHIPVVADIHFDYRMALLAIGAGADKIRINPGNIGGADRVAEVVRACKERQIPIRVGVNSGSLEKEILQKYGGVTAAGLVESALDKVHMIEEAGYDNLVISIKSSHVPLLVEAYEMLAAQSSYPTHVGLTEAGTVYTGSVKSAVAIGILLEKGIGDTIRVSLSGDPVEEVKAARIILRSLGLIKSGIDVIACPTCGRTQIDLIGLAARVEQLAQSYDLTLSLAVMGCVVNGPGEARGADLGIAGGKGEGLLIKKGEIVRKLKEEEFLPALKYELDHWND
ncbi:MAG: flavodoxin-dependent (E)-4-hydroxy-3-methylbut-2-enyl-diphosphate synthase [Lachnospiraceae bacterium]|nr:flavodoxin-dependent (E)-4-hydroxy-3-methylbut-2-enyl-diphosphate synthase [Lachnospiraceae bacterium]